MKQLLIFLVFLLMITSCSIERRLYMPGYHVEVRSAKCEVRGAKCEVRSAKDEVQCETDDDNLIADAKDELHLVQKELFETAVISAPAEQYSIRNIDALHPSPLTLRPSPFSPDTLKKTFKPQGNYREIDPVGKVSVVVVLAGVALQKIAGMLTWFEVIMPLSFGPGIFIPALIVALIGLGLSAYSAYRVRKYPEKYKKNEWGKAALAILGWQILMSVLFAWLLGGLPIG